jgi:hypothetical protein
MAPKSRKSNYCVPSHDLWKQLRSFLKSKKGRWEILRISVH